MGIFVAGSRSSSRSVAERYVNAIFKLAAGDNKILDTFGRFFAALEPVLADNAGMRRILADPTVSRRQKADVMETIASALKAESGQKHFLILLARNNRLEILPAIIAVFRERLADLRGELVLEITTARAPSPAALDSIKAAMEKETGKTMILKTRHDPAILGGITVRIGSRLLDYSVEGKLRRLQHSLARHIVNA